MRRALLLLTAMAAMLVALAGAVVAATAVDQQQTDSSTASAIDHDQILAQTFTAGVDGQLDKVSVAVEKQVGTGASLPGDLIVEIESVDGAGQPSGIALGSGTAAAENIPTFSGQLNPSPAGVDITLTQPAQVSKGTQYALVLSAPGTTSVSRYLWYEAAGTTYSGGVKWVFRPSFDLVFSRPTEDMTFKTYVSSDDTTPPVISKVVTGTLGNNGWYTSNVNVDWTVSDPESDISSQAGCDDVSVTTDQGATTYTCEATSAGGTSSDSVTIKRDATAPTLNPSVSPNPVLLNGSATADAGAQDNLSGIASQSCDPVDTTNVGANKSVSCSATDNAGNTNSASANYSVNYKFVGFSSPVDNGGVLNVVKAGQTIPLKWQIMDAKDVPVTNLSSSNVKVSVANLSCGLSTTTDQLEEVAAGSSGLQNLGGGYYQLNWKSPTSYAKSCKTLTLDLGEGTLTTPHTALFKFSK